MTRDEYRKDRNGLIRDYRYLVIQWLEGVLKEEPKIEEFEKELDALDIEYAATQADPLRDYYDYRNAVDGACRMIKEAEGRPVREIAANIAMIDICTQRNAVLQSKERDS